MNGESDDINSVSRMMPSWQKLKGPTSYAGESHSGKVYHKDELIMEKSKTSSYKRRKSMITKVPTNCRTSRT